MRSAVIPDECIARTDGIHLLPEGSYLAGSYELIIIPVTDEHLCPQQALTCRCTQQAAMEAYDPLQVISQPRCVDQHTAAKTIPNGADLRRVYYIVVPQPRYGRIDP